MSKIAMLISGLRNGGAEGVCVTLANGFVERGVEVKLVVLNLDGAVRIKDLDIRVKLTNLNLKNARKSFFLLREFIKENSIDNILVFNFQLTIMLVLIRICTTLNYKIIARNISTLSDKSKYETNLWHKYITHAITRLLYNKSDVIIAQSQGMADDLLANYRIKKEQVIIIHNPIKPEFELLLKEQPCFLSDNKNEILFVGRLNTVKGLEYILNAFSKQDFSKYILRIVGDGELKQELQLLADKLGILERVIFEGFQPKTVSFFRNAQVTVLASLYEGFPNVLVESIAVGTPVVSFNCKSGPSEIIQDGVNGYLVKYLDVEDLAYKLKTALEKEWDKEKIKQTALRFESRLIIEQYLRALFF